MSYSRLSVLNATHDNLTGLRICHSIPTVRCLYMIWRSREKKISAPNDQCRRWGRTFSVNIRICFSCSKETEPDRKDPYSDIQVFIEPLYHSFRFSKRAPGVQMRGRSVVFFEIFDRLFLCGLLVHIDIHGHVQRSDEFLARINISYFCPDFRIALLGLICAVIQPSDTVDTLLMETSVMGFPADINTLGPPT